MNEPSVTAAVLRRVMDVLPRSIVVTDAAGTIVLWNDLAEQLFGWTEADVVGRPIGDVLAPIGPDETPAVPPGLLESGDSMSIERTVLRRDGSAVRVKAITRAVLDEQGAVQFIVAASEDVDQLRLLEASARAANRLEGLQRQRLELISAVDARLAALGWQLAAAADLDQVLSVITDDAGKVMDADAVQVGLVFDAEHVHVVRTGTPFTPEAIARFDVHDVRGPSALARAVRSGERQFVQVSEGDDPDVSVPSARALIASPLFDANAHPIGVLVFSWRSDRRFDEFDRTAIETLSRLCGQAVRHAETSGYTNQLADLASSMAGARTTGEVAELLSGHGGLALGAIVASLRVLDDASGMLRTVIDSALPDGLLRRYQQVHLTEHLPMSDAARLDVSVWVPNLADYDRRYPDVAAEARQAGLGASAAVPLHASDGSVIGAVAFAWNAAMSFDAPLRARLATLCELAGQTLERVHLYEAEHALITTMQRQLLTPLPEVPGLELAAFYEPAAVAVGMGGDWYDALTLADGSLVAIIGDIVGHGVEAVASMSRLQHLVTSLIRLETPLHEVFERANTLSRASDPIYATALLLHIDTDRNRLGVLSAGHPPPLLRTPDGSVRVLGGGRQAMVGARIAPCEIDYVDLPADSTVVAYTDGLIERRGEGISTSIERLRGQLEAIAGTGTADDLLDQLIDAVAEQRDDRATDDDIAALVVRHAAR